MNHKSYVLVKLIKGWAESLWYEVPEHLGENLRAGSVVEVPLRKALSFAVVTRISQTLPQSIKFKLRVVASLAKYPEDKKFNDFIKVLARFYFVSQKQFHRRMLGFLEASNKKLESNVCFDSSGVVSKFPDLTDEQLFVLKSIEPFLNKNEFKPFLFHGVTGSGKTEIYKRLIDQVISSGKVAIFMLPEVSLCARFYSIFKAGLSENIKIFRFDSASSVTEKRTLWKVLMNGEPCLIIGVHLPVLLPRSKMPFSAEAQECGCGASS